MVISLLQQFFLILLTENQCTKNKPGLFITGKAVWKTPASYVTNAAMTKAWWGQRDRMISCLWQQNSAQKNWILSPNQSWKKSSAEIDSFSNRLQIVQSRSTCNSIIVKIDLSLFNQTQTSLWSMSCIFPCGHPHFHGAPQRTQQIENRPWEVQNICSLLI